MYTINFIYLVLVSILVSPAHIYGTPKIHKFSPSGTFPKHCPIFLSIGTFNDYLANPFPLWSPFTRRLLPDYYSCKNTFSFASQIKNGNLSGKFLVTYNVTSPFTNIPLPETNGIATNLIVDHNPNLNVTKKELFLFVTLQTFLLW